MDDDEFALSPEASEIPTVDKVKDLISNSLSTEEVEEVYEHIVGSYHYDVFKKEIEDE